MRDQNDAGIAPEVSVDVGGTACPRTSPWVERLGTLGARDEPAVAGASSNANLRSCERT